MSQSQLKKRACGCLNYTPHTDPSRLVDVNWLQEGRMLTSESGPRARTPNARRLASPAPLRPRSSPQGISFILILISASILFLRADEKIALVFCFVLSVHRQYKRVYQMVAIYSV